MKLLGEISYLEQYTTSLTKVFIDYAPKLVAAIVLLFVGLWFIKIINRIARKILFNREIDPTLIEFLSDILLWGLRVMLFIAVISKLGIESSSFVAILGAAGLAVGLSLQGSLSNFAGGMLIILFKPFKMGDIIEAQGVSGTVIDIQIFVTQLLTANNQVIFVPNGVLSNGTIINYSTKKTRRTDIIISFAYNTDLKKVKELIFEIIKKNNLILKDPKATIFVKELTESSIKIAVRAWTKSEYFNDVSSYILEECKAKFDANDIVIVPVEK
jgi:small conductance mechanosensitive channel